MEVESPWEVSCDDPDKDERDVLRLPREPVLPRSPKSGNEHKVPSFLSFHHEKVYSGHYYRDDDAQALCTRGVLIMAQRFLPMQYAVASFASLVYSVQIDPRMRPLGFVYYAEALRLLQPVLDEVMVKSDDWLIVLAAVLQLAAVEVWLPFYRSYCSAILERRQNVIDMLKELRRFFSTFPVRFSNVPPH